MILPKDKQLWIENMQAVHAHTIMGVLGIELVDIDDDHIELSMPITDAAGQPDEDGSARP